METYPKLVLLLTIPSIIPLGRSFNLRLYNEPCQLYDQMSNCNSSQGLLCVDTGLKGYRCRCPSDTKFDTIFDPTRQMCVGKVLNSCVSGGPSENETFCVENAECNKSVYYLPLCMCRQGFQESDDGTCVPAAKYGEPCDVTKNDCDLKSGLTCVATSGKCACEQEPENLQFYDNAQEKCVTYVGGKCSLVGGEQMSLCVPHADCVGVTEQEATGRSIIFGSQEGSDHNNLPLSSITPANGLQGKCMCKSGYSSSSHGFCMKSHGVVCQSYSAAVEQGKGNFSWEMCNSDQFLECLDAHDGHFRCQCRNPLNERWSVLKNQCVSILGRKCRNSPDYPRCIEGAECVNDFCQCKTGTSATPGGSCRLDYNQKCQPGECNANAGLTCHGKTSTCLCLDSYLTYDMERKACVATVGSPCGKLDGFNGMAMGIFRSQPTGQSISSRRRLGEVPSNSRSSNDGPAFKSLFWEYGERRELIRHFDSEMASVYIQCENGSTCEKQGGLGYFCSMKV